MLWSAGKVLLFAYFLWTVYVTILVGSLTKIRSSSWHYMLFDYFHGGRMSPANAAHYRLVLIFFPLVYFAYYASTTLGTVFLVLGHLCQSVPELIEGYHNRSFIEAKRILKEDVYRRFRGTAFCKKIGGDYYLPLE